MSQVAKGVCRERDRDRPFATGYLVFDVETTGLGDRCRIVEFAGLLLDDDAMLSDQYETLVDSESAPGPTRLHGIDATMLHMAPRFVDVAGEIQRLFRDRIPVAHNLRFDWGVLRRAYERLGVEMPATAGICTAQLSRRILGGPCALTQVCRRLGIDHPQPHRAGTDATATWEVFRALRQLEPRLVYGRPCPVFAGAWRLPRSLPARRRADLEAAVRDQPSLELGHGTCRLM